MERERDKGGGKGGVNLVCVNADLFVQHFSAGCSTQCARGCWEVVGGGREVTARRGDKSAWLLQLFVVLSSSVSFSSLSFYFLFLLLILPHMHTHKSVPFLRVGPQLDYSVTPDG
jgi:hypothetical protein